MSVGADAVFAFENFTRTKAFVDSENPLIVTAFALVPAAVELVPTGV